MRILFRTAVVIVLLAIILTAYLAGNRMGYRRGIRQGCAQELVKLASYEIGELHEMRRLNATTIAEIGRRERRLEEVLIGITLNTSAEELKTVYPYGMEDMLYAKKYRQMFPYRDERMDGTNSLWYVSLHAQLQKLLDALPEPDEFMQARIDKFFSSMERPPNVSRGAAPGVRRHDEEQDGK